MHVFWNVTQAQLGPLQPLWTAVSYDIKDRMQSRSCAISASKSQVGAHTPYPRHIFWIQTSEEYLRSGRADMGRSEALGCIHFGCTQSQFSLGKLAN